MRGCHEEVKLAGCWWLTLTVTVAVALAIAVIVAMAVSLAVSLRDSCEDMKLAGGSQ